MNVCALDVVARSTEFETVAATMEMRAWEWNFLHDIDGETSLGELARQRGVDLDSAIGLVTDAMQRGLVVIPTVTLEAYRSHTAPQTSLRGTSPAVALGSAALADAPFDFSTQPPSTGAISFSSDAFDWNAPEPAFEESEDAPEVASAPEKLGSVHYDDRFGVDHPGGPFAVSEPHDAPFRIESHHEDEPTVPVVASAPTAPHAESFADVSPFDEVTPFSEAAPLVDVAPTLLDPFAATAHPADPFAVEDPFAVAPSENGKTYSNGASSNGHVPVRFDELFTEVPPDAPAHDVPAHDVFAPAPAPTTIHFDAASFDDVPFEAPAETYETASVAHVPIDPPVTVTHAAAVTQPVPDAHRQIEEEAEPQSEPGSISFSFSADDPAGTHETFEAHGVRESPEIWTPPAQAAATPVAAPAPAEPVAKAAPTASEPSKGTQSLYFEREAIDTDAGREHDEKVKNWKDSLSWREQQQINEALGTGEEKPGVIGSLLRALGVR